MKYYKIKKCRCCHSTNFKEIIDFGRMSLSTSFTQKNSKNNFVPLKLIYCKKCYLTQLNHNYEPNKIYNKNYGYRSGINKSMNLHLEGIVSDARKIVSLTNKDIVLDIASNDGTLLKKYKSKKLIKIGIDPTIKKFKKFYNSDVLTLADYFTSKKFFKISKNVKAKIITSIAVFYDVSKPDKFIQDIKKILEKNGVWVLEQSYLPSLIKNNAYDSVCHEHLTYFMVHQINILLKKFNLRIYDIKENSMNGGSIRIFISHYNSNLKTNKKNIEKIINLENKILKNPSNTFKIFRKNIELSKKNLFDYIVNLKKIGKTIHIYGASTKGNIILQYCKIDNSLIEFAADRNKDKIGKKTAGTNIKIISEKESRTMKPDFYLVMPWHFKDEFIKREQSFLKKGGKFIFPLPKVTII